MRPKHQDGKERDRQDAEQSVYLDASSTVLDTLSLCKASAARLGYTSDSMYHLSIETILDAIPASLQWSAFIIQLNGTTLGSVCQNDRQEPRLRSAVLETSCSYDDEMA